MLGGQEPASAGIFVYLKQAGDRITVTERLEELLSGEPPQALPESLRHELETELRTALAAQRFGEAAEWVEAQAGARAKDIRLRFLAAVLQEIEDDPRRAAVSYRELARALADAGDWEAVRALCVRALPLRPDERVVRLLLRAWDNLQTSPQREADLEVARSLCPEAPELLWEAAKRADATGDSAAAEKLACRAVAGFARAGLPERAEEALLRALESESDETFRGVVETLPVLAQEGFSDLFDTALEFLQPEIESRNLREPLLAALESVLVEREGTLHWRPLFVDLTIAQFGGEEAIGGLARTAGLPDPTVPLREALVRFRELSALRPGVYVEHSSWGVGRVTANDGRALTIDFADRPAHRMGIDLAVRSLRSLTDDLLRVRVLADPEGLRRQAEEDPVAILAQALREAGGQASTQELRKAIEGLAVAGADWSKWWTKARKRIPDDPRVDDSLAYRQVYQLGSETTAGPLALPPLDTSKGLRPAVATIGRLLKQHPHLKDAAVRSYGPELTARLSVTGDHLERLAVLPLLHQWYPERTADWIAVLNQAVAANLGVASVTGEADQQELLSLGLTGEGWVPVVLSALPSRFAPVRDQAWAALQERVGDSLRDVLLSALADARNNPAVALSIVEAALAGRESAAFLLPEHPWELFLGVASALATSLPPPLGKRAEAAFRPAGALVRALRARPCPETLSRKVSLVLARDGLGAQSLTLLAEALETAGRTEFSEPLRRRLAPPPAADEQDPLLQVGLRPGITYMTKATFRRQREQLRNLETQLRVDLPAAVKKARELGDLSENAEYHAAREAQSIAASQVARLQYLLENVSYIEDLERPDGVATLGTVVRIRWTDTDKVQTVWLLGEGDDYYGDDVVSYTAELGKRLLGKRAGDKVEMEVDGRSSRFEVLSVEPKLPERN